MLKARAALAQARARGDLLDPLESERFRYFVKENLSTHWLGALTLSALVLINVRYLPLWSWVPALALHWLTTLWRLYLFVRSRDPQARWPLERQRAWHTLGAAIQGACWGLTDTLMGFYVPEANRLLIAAVWGVAMGYAAVAAIPFTAPALVFIALGSLPLLASYFVQGLGPGQEILLGLGLLFCLHIAVTLLQMRRRSASLTETLRLRLDNEALARELAIQRDVAEAEAHAKHRLLSVVSHDLRQPVQALMIYQELLLPEAQLSDRGRNYFDRLKTAVEQVSDLLEGLLRVAREQPAPGPAARPALDEIQQQETRHGARLP